VTPPPTDSSVPVQCPVAVLYDVTFFDPNRFSCASPIVVACCCTRHCHSLWPSWPPLTMPCLSNCCNVRYDLFDQNDFSYASPIVVACCCTRLSNSLWPLCPLWTRPYLSNCFTIRCDLCDPNGFFIVTFVTPFELGRACPVVVLDFVTFVTQMDSVVPVQLLQPVVVLDIVTLCDLLDHYGLQYTVRLLWPLWSNEFICASPIVCTLVVVLDVVGDLCDPLWTRPCLSNCCTWRRDLSGPQKGRARDYPPPFINYDIIIIAQAMPPPLFSSRDAKIHVFFC
jgi:hypothetical protein